MLKFNGVPSRERLEELFPEAVKYLKDWTLRCVREYWLGQHNRIVKNNPLCQVYAAEVQEVLLPEDNEICRAEVSFGLKAKSYIPLKEGDRVSLHGFQVAERLSQKDIKKYFK